MQKLKIATTPNFNAAIFAQLVGHVYRVVAPNLSSFASSLRGMNERVLAELRTENLNPPRDTHYTVELFGSLNDRDFHFIHELLPLKQLWSEGNRGAITSADVDEIERRIWPQIHISIHESRGRPFIALPEFGPLEMLPFLYRKALERLTLFVSSRRSFRMLQNLLRYCENLQYLDISFVVRWVSKNYELRLPNSVTELAVYMTPRLGVPVMLRCDGELDRMYLDLTQFDDKMEFEIQSIGTLELRNCRWKVREEIESLVTLGAQNVEMDTPDGRLLRIFQPAAHTLPPPQRF